MPTRPWKVTEPLPTSIPKTNNRPSGGYSVEESILRLIAQDRRPVRLRRVPRGRMRFGSRRTAMGRQVGATRITQR